MAGDQVVTLRLTGENGQLLATLKTSKAGLNELGPTAEQVGERTERGMSRGTAAARLYGSAVSSASGMLRQLALGAAAAVGIGGLAAMMSASVGAARDFGQAMAEVSTVAGDTSKMDALTQSVRALAKEYGQAPAAQAKALYEIISAGISDTARATETLDAANRLALGGITEVETAADGLTTVLNAYGAAAGSATEVSDRLFVAALAGKTTIGELSASIGNAAPIAAQTGVSLDELLASVAALTLGGVKTSTAVDGIRATIAAIIKPSQEATEMAAALGLQFDAAALKSQGLAAFLDNVATATGGSADKLAVLFGGVEALAPVMALTGNQADAFAATLDSMANSAGVTDEAVSKMADTAQFQFARLKAVVGESLLSIGESILSVLTPAAKALADNWEAISSGIVVATKVAATWLTVFVAVPALWSAATAAVVAYATARAAATAADEMGIARSVASIGTLQAAGGVLVGAIAGWQIGTWLRENFLEAELAGIAFVEGTLVGYQRLKQGVLIVWEGIKAAGVGAMNAVREAIATMFANLAAAADVEVFGEKLFGSTAEGLRELEAAIRPAKSSAESLQDAIAKVNSEADAEVAKIRTLTGEMADYAISHSEAADTSEALATATGTTTQAITEQGSALALTKEQVEAQQRALAGLVEIQREAAAALGGPMVENALRLAEELARIDEVERDLIETHQLSAEAADQLRIARGALIDSYRLSQDEVIAARNAAQLLLDEMDREIQLASMSADARRNLASALQFEDAMRRAIDEAMRAGNTTIAAQTELLLEQARVRGELMVSAEETARAAESAARESQRAWEDLALGMADAVLDGSDGVKRYWRQLIDDLKRQLIASGLLSIFGQIFNTGGAGAGMGNSLLGQLLGGGGGSGSGLLGNLFGGGSGTGASMLPALAALAGGAFGLTNRGSSTGSAGSIAAAGAYGYAGYALGTVGYGAALGASGALAGGASAAAGATSGALGAAGAIPVVGWIIAAIAAIDMITGGKVFGTRYRAESGTTSLSLGEDGGTASQTIREVRQRALFGGRQWRNRSVTATDEAVEAAQQLFDNVRGVMTDSARALNGEAPAMIDAALRTVVEYDKKGKVKATKYFVDLLGRTWEEQTAEAATQRIMAEAMIATIDSILGTTVEAATAAGGQAGADVVGAVAAGAQGAVSTATDTIIKSVAGAQGEASAIAERWRDDAAQLMDGAQMLLAAAVDIRAGRGLLGEGGTLTQIADLIEELQQPGEALAATYARVSASVGLLDQALGMMGVSLSGTREDLVRMAVDIADAAGGLPRAQQLWSTYFEQFFTAEERLQYQLAQAQQRASGLFQAQGLNLTDYTGDGGAAAFRALFEQQLPTLSAAAVVQWLEMAEALGIVIDLSAQASGSIGEVADTLAELMAGVSEQLAEYAPPLSFAQQLAAINTETEALIARATELGATEEQLAQIRELGAARVGDVLAQQADAYRQYADLVRGLADEAADLRGLTDYQREMREIDRWTRQTADALNSAARAAGMQAAAEEDLALMHEIAASRAAAAAARLAQRGRDIVAQLAGSRLTQVDQQMGEVGTAVGTWMSQAAGGMDQVTQATDSAVQALIGAQQRVRDWLNGIMSSELSGLRPRDRLTELLALAERTRVAAAGGDAEAMARMPQLADEILRLGRDVYASGGQYFELRDLVRGWMQDLADIVIPTPEPGTGGGGGGGGGGGFGGGVGDTLEQQQEASAQAAAERRALWMELVAVIRDMMSAPDQTLQGIEETLGFSMRDLVTELGVSLTDMTVATASQLAGIAQAMGVELTDLASHVGVSLGSLGDRQSLLNDALESTIATLPAGQRDLLEPLLRDVEEAAALGDVAGVEAGISDMEDAIAEMAPELRDLLAPYFARIVPADPATELSHLASLDTTMGSSLSELQAQTLHLAAIEGLLNGGGGLPLQPTGPLTPGGGFGGGGVPPPGYAVGTSYVPSDGLAYLHRGEMVWPAAVSDFFRREGIPVSAPPRAFGARSNDAGDPAVTGLLRDLVATARESQAELRALRERVAQLESTIAQGDDRKVRALDRQTDRLNRT